MRAPLAFCAHRPHDTCCCSQPGHSPHLRDRTIHAAAMWPCATQARVRYAHTSVEHHNTRYVANAQHLHTMPCCNTTTRPRAEDGAENSLTLHGKAPAPLARPGTPHNARAKLQCPACCKCHRVQALVQPRTVPARTTAQPTNQPQSLASPSQTRARPASKHAKPEQPAKWTALATIGISNIDCECEIASCELWCECEYIN